MPEIAFPHGSQQGASHHAQREIANGRAKPAVEVSRQVRPLLRQDKGLQVLGAKTDSSGNPLEGVKFRLEDEHGTNLGEYVSDKDGIVSITGLDSGVYYIRETETLEGFSVSGEVIKFVLDENYVIPETMPKMINYTIIQTGVRIAVTGVMILGAVFVVVSGILFIIRKKKNAKAQED